MSLRRWKDEDAASYDQEVAQHYDRWVGRLADPLAEHLCRLAQLRRGQHVLDVGCGSGVGTRVAARCVGERGSVIGVDLSNGMLAAARVGGEIQPNITYLNMDAEILAFAPETFDSVISLCAVTHFPQVGQALREMAMVLKTGGRMVVSYGHARPIKSVDLARHLVKRLGQKLNQFRPTLQAPGSLETVISDYMTARVEDIAPGWSLNKPYRHLVDEMREVGLQGIELSWCGHELSFSSPEEFLEAQLAISTKARKQLKTLSSHEVATVKSEHVKRARRVLERGGRLLYPYGAQFISGTKSGT